MYCSAYFDIKTGEEIIVRDDISDKDLTIIKGAQATFLDIFAYVDYYYIVYLNYKDLKDNLYIDLDEKTLFINANRLLSNCLNSYYIWKDYMVKHTVVKETKQSVKNMYNDTILIIADRLRHRSVHNSPIVVEFSYDILNETPSFNLNFEKVISKKELDGLKERERLWIGEHPKIEVCEFMDLFINSFIKMNAFLLTEIKANIQKLLNKLEPFVPPETVNTYNTSVKDLDTGASFHLGMTYKTLTDKSTLIEETFRYFQFLL